MASNSTKVMDVEFKGYEGWASSDDDSTEDDEEVAAPAQCNAQMCEGGKCSFNASCSASGDDNNTCQGNTCGSDGGICWSCMANAILPGFFSGGSSEFSDF